MPKIKERYDESFTTNKEPTKAQLKVALERVVSKLREKPRAQQAGMGGPMGGVSPGMPPQGLPPRPRPSSGMPPMKRGGPPMGGGRGGFPMKRGGLPMGGGKPSPRAMAELLKKMRGKSPKSDKLGGGGKAEELRQVGALMRTLGG